MLIPLFVLSDAREGILWVSRPLFPPLAIKGCFTANWVISKRCLSLSNQWLQRLDMQDEAHPKLGNIEYLR